MGRQAVVERSYLDRFRVAMRASVWAWALYWPGGGLLLLLGGLDPLSILVTIAGLTGFILVVRTGFLRPTSSRNLKELFLERPMYVVGGFVLLIFMAPIFSSVEDLGLRATSLLFLAALSLALVRMWQFVDAEKLDIRQSKADQVFILLGIQIFAAFLVFLDAWLPAFGADPVAGPSYFVAMVNWVNLLFPPMLLLAARPFRDRLQNPFKVPVPDDGPAPAKAASRAKA